MPLPETRLRSYRGHRGPVLAVRLSADGQYAMCGGQDKKIHLFNPHRSDPEAARADSALPVRVYEGPHGYRVQDIALTRDSAMFASCGGEKIAFLWDVRQGRVVRKLQGHDQHLNALTFAAEADSLLLTASYDGTVACWDLRSRGGRPVQVLDDAQDSVMAVTSVGAEIVAGSVDGCVRTYDVRSARVLKDELGEPVASLAVSGDSFCALAATLDNTLRLLDRSSGDVLCEYRGHANASYRVEAVLTNSDSHVVGGSEDGVVRCWDLVSGSVAAELRGHTKTVASLAYHPTQTMLLTGSYDGEVGVWV